MNLPQQILNLLEEKATSEFEYINPYFLLQITEALENYYHLESDIVSDWVQDMFGA